MHSPDLPTSNDRRHPLFALSPNTCRKSGISRGCTGGGNSQAGNLPGGTAPQAQWGINPSGKESLTCPAIVGFFFTPWIRRAVCRQEKCVVPEPERQASLIFAWCAGAAMKGGAGIHSSSLVTFYTGSAGTQSLRGEDQGETVSSVKVRPGAGMDQRPVASRARYVPDDGAYGNFHGLACRDDLP